MFKNVKSSYFIQKLFSFLDECLTLKLLKHNKNMQKNINISINNYIHFKRKYCTNFNRAQTLFENIHSSFFPNHNFLMVFY